MIVVEQLTKTFGPVRAVDHVSFTARAGRVIGFLGANGGGKSTTMRMMVGLTRPTSGSATIGGQAYDPTPVVPCAPGLVFFTGALTAAQWQHLALTTVVWLIAPLIIGVIAAVRTDIS